MAFEGFPRNVRATPVPDPFFNSLLEEIEDLAELKVTLRALWLLGQGQGAHRYLAEGNLLSDATLVRALPNPGGHPQDRVRQGLELAVTRGTLLRHTSAKAPGERFYLLNTEANRRFLAERAGAGMPATVPYQPVAGDTLPGPAPDKATEINIFALYENNIGTIGPMIAEQLAEAEQRYPAGWIEEAFKQAVYANKRSWNYVAAILRRWGAEGRGGFTDQAQEPPATTPGIGKQAGATLWEGKEGQHGEPGRHTEAGQRSRQPASRQRR